MKDFISIVVLFIFTLPGFASNNYQDKLHVYFDCKDCDMTYLKSTITTINYVRDRKLADLQIIINGNGNGAGGVNYTLRFLGLQPHTEKINFEMEMNVEPGKTKQEIREKMVEVINSGLAPYLSNGQFKEIEKTGNNTSKKVLDTKDKWNYWVFSISSEFELNRESRREEIEFENELDIDRITEEWRIRGELNHEFKRNKLQKDDGEFVSDLNTYYGSFSVVISLGSHYSAGIFSSLWSNSVKNIATGSSLKAAFEYNFFPYREVYKRELTIAYFLGINTFHYEEETLYDRTSEQLYGQSIAIEYNTIQPWGGIRAKAEGFAFIEDFSKNRMEFDLRISNRIFKGLFLNLSGEVAFIRDQIYLPKGNASIEEILLDRKSLATDFEYGFNVGLSYVFGSTYNNVVNTRL
ncbi:hypothetical protein [Flexithrix dorotheae]|uniref:hypothetical protein n=1 Tax=Flexithrix dorotheae TaxID=70993 RepID=UPI000381A278|nr:hypothetical protein [Flexithrix dorotheae]